jgi:mannose/fructose-specific phosphotransferase system component IIA
MKSNTAYSPQKDENFSKRNFNLNHHEKPFLQDIFGATPSNKNMSGSELEERAGEMLGGERLGAQESVSKCLQYEKSDQPC